MTTAETSVRMSRIRQHGTAPELLVRKAASAAGLRYRVHNRDLPGSPDLANRKCKFAIFVHGCYWHRHRGCKKATSPKSNAPFWNAKFLRNQERDAAAVRELVSMGFAVATVWECQTGSPSVIEGLLAKELKLPRKDTRHA